MKLATTTGDFAMCASSWEECLKGIHDAGFRYVDFGVANREFLYDDGWRDRTKRLMEYAESLGMKFIQMHSPDNIDPLDPVRQDELVEITARSIEIAAMMGIPQTVVHFGSCRGLSKEEFYKKNLEFYSRLFPAMESTGINVLVENSPRAHAPEGCWCLSTGEELADFLHFADHPLLHAVWDTGHGNLDGPQYESIIALGSELRGLHIHDNGGRADEHALPLSGTVSFDGVMHGLLEIGYSGYFTFEAVRILEYKNGQAPRRRYEADRRLRHPTFELQLEAEKLLYAIGKHILCSYGVFEE